MAYSGRSNKSTPKKNLKLITLEIHIDYWEEARIAKRHHFLSTMDIDITQINNWLVHNSKYYYDSDDVQGLKEMYLDMCSTLLIVRNVFNYEIVGKIFGFLLTDGRFYVKPFQFSKSIKEIHETFISVCKLWDETVLHQFTYPYKTLLSIRYEIQDFILYLSLEESAQKLVAPTSHFDFIDVVKMLLSSLHLPMSLYFDCFHLRKLLYQISQKAAPAFSLQCIHPVISQVQYVFQLYYKNIHIAWEKIDGMSHIPLSMMGFSYLMQNFLVDNYNNMIYWKGSDFKTKLEQIVMPNVLIMLGNCMPLDVIDRLLVQGFYDIIEMDSIGNFVRCQFDVIQNDINIWQILIETWNEGIPFIEFRVTADKNLFLQKILSSLFYKGVEDWKYTELCVNLIHDFFSNRVRTVDCAEILLRFMSKHNWISDNTLHTQIQNWFQSVLDLGADIGLESDSINDTIIISVDSSEEMG